MSPPEQSALDPWNDDIGLIEPAEERAEREERGESPFDLREGVFFAVLRFWPLVAAVLVLGCVIGLAYGFSLPNEYTSQGKIHLKLSRVEQRTLDSLMPDGQTGGANTTGMNDELELLRNPAVHERVVRQLGVGAVLRPSDPAAQDTSATPLALRWLHRAQSWWFARNALGLEPSTEKALLAAAARAQASVYIDAVPRSNIILVAYTADDPQLAQRAVDAYLDVAKQWHRESFASNEQRDFLEREYQKRRAELEQAQARLAEHLAQCRLEALDLVQAGLVQQRMALEQGIEEGRIRLDVVAQELASTARLLEETEAWVETLVYADLLDHPGYQSALAELRRLRQAWMELEVYAPTSEQFLRGRERLERSIGAQEAVLAELEQELERAAPLARRVPNPRIAELEAHRTERMREQDGLLVSIAGNRERLAKLDERLEQAASCARTHHLLELDIETGEAHLRELAVQLQKEATLDTISAQERLSSLTVIQRGTVPPGKDGPRRWKYLFAGLCAAGAAAVALASLLQLASSRLRYGAGLQRTLGLEVLAVVPETRRLRRRRRKRSAAAESGGTRGAVP